MSSPLLSRSSSDTCSFLLSSFSSSDPPHTDPLVDLPPPSSPPASNARIYEQDAEIPSSFLNPQVATALDLSPLDMLATMSPAGHESVDGRDGDAGGGSVPEQLDILQETQLSTPTMHPNLVSTLKSIICPLSCPTSRSQQEIGQEEHVLDMAYEAPTPPTSLPFVAGASVPNVGFPGFHRLFTEAAASPSPPSSMSEPKQAAIVPIHLIQNRRPYRCSFGGCNKTFKNPQTLKMHHKTHCSSNGSTDHGGVCSRGKFLHSLATVPQSCKAGQNKKIPSRCPICKRAFVGLYELRRHFGRKHSEGEKTHACNKCGKRFYIEVDLRDHQKLCGEPLHCKCGMKFAFKCNLVAHKKTHPACQEEPEQPGCQDAHGRMAPNSAPPPLLTKHFFFPCEAMTSTPADTIPPKYAMSASPSMAMASFAPPSMPSSSTHVYRPVVKAEHFSCNSWLASAVLGVSRAL